MQEEEEDLERGTCEQENSIKDDLVEMVGSNAVWDW